MQGDLVVSARRQLSTVSRPSHPVSSSMERSNLQRSLLLAAFVVTCLALAADCAVLRTRRDVDESTNENHVKVCRTNTPCGWAVYIPLSRRVDYFMKNTCECPKGKLCTRTDDDLSASAYVYRCRTPAEDA